MFHIFVSDVCCNECRSKVDKDFTRKCNFLKRYYNRSIRREAWFIINVWNKLLLYLHSLYHCVLNGLVMTKFYFLFLFFSKNYVFRLFQVYFHKWSLSLLYLFSYLKKIWESGKETPQKEINNRRNWSMKKIKR